MRDSLEKAWTADKRLEMIYISQAGNVTQRDIRVIQVGAVSFRAYCFLRRSTRTFKRSNVLALVPSQKKQRRLK